MLKFWIDKIYVPKEDLYLYSEYKNACVPIYIDEICKLCNTKRILSKNFIDSENCSSTFSEYCNHSHTYQMVYKFRIKNTGTDPLNDGAKCAGRCGNWVPLAAPNQSDGTFICFGCRNSW